VRTPLGQAAHDALRQYAEVMARRGTLTPAQLAARAESIGLRLEIEPLPETSKASLETLSLDLKRRGLIDVDQHAGVVAALGSIGK